MKSYYGALKHYHEKTINAIPCNAIHCNKTFKHVEKITNNKNALQQIDLSIDSVKPNSFWPIKVVEKTDPIYTSVQYNIHSIIYRN